MKWTDYTTKETLEDNDELMILDADVKANKRTLMSKIWNYVVDKMTSAVVAKLTTTDKTVLGAINELNSNQADSGWVSLNDQHCVYYRLKNGYVTVVINSNSEIIDGTVLGQLPNNLIPQKDLYTSNYSKNGAALCIRTNGDVSWNNTSSYNHCAVTYPI